MICAVWKKTILMVSLALVSVSVYAQDEAFADAVRRFAGETEVESLHQDLMDSLEDLYHRPLNINSASPSRLHSSGLFTPFQIASLVDYRQRHGGVMSMLEFSNIDGFSQDYVQRISSFVSLGTDACMSGTSPKGLSGEVALRGGYKYYLEKSYGRSTYALKARGTYSDRFSFCLSLNEPYDSLRLYPTGGTVNMAWMHQKGKVIVGNYNARFGQGLCLWNTASFSSLTSPAAFMKRPSGVSPSNSFTGSSAMTGFAADYSVGGWMLSALVDFPGLRHAVSKPEKLMISPALNLTRYGRFGHLSFTHNMAFGNLISDSFRIPRMVSSFDASSCIRGVNIFGEAAYDWVSSRLAFLAGCEGRAGEVLNVAALVRYIPVSDEHGAALSGEIRHGRHEGVFSIDCKYDAGNIEKKSAGAFQVKGQMNWNWTIAAFLQLRMRLSQRLRPGENSAKTQLRTEIRHEYSKLKSTLRYECLYGRGFASLGYAETGYVSDMLSLYARVGFFAIDQWDDRIYVYERDAPGNFNVPAFYGRGVWTSLYLSARLYSCLKLYMRGIYKKPGNAELKCQCVLRF